MNRKERPLAELETIPGVGPSIAQDLRDLGFRRVGDLAGRDPQEMYEALCKLQGARLDRCLLYVFRCATYYASRGQHDPELLKWWNWKDPERDSRTRRTSRRSSRGATRPTRRAGPAR